MGITAFDNTLCTHQVQLMLPGMLVNGFSLPCQQPDWWLSHGRVSINHFQ